MNKIELGKIANIRTGKLDANASSEDGRYPFFTCSKEPLSINSYSYDCECVLVAGNGDLNVKYFNGKFDAYQRTYIIEAKDKSELSVKYLYNFIDSKMDFIRSQSIGGVIKYIKLGDLTSLKIPLPPLTTQQTISSELDLLNSLINKQKAQLTELDRLAQSVFYDMFGDPVENEKGWEVKKLGELSEKIGDGLHGTPEYSENSEYYFINGNNLIEGDIIISALTQCVSKSEYEKHYIKFNDKTLFVSINGTIGKVAYYKDEKVILGKSACYIILQNDCILKTFLYALLRSDYFREYASKEKTGSTISNVSLKSMRNMPIILPPLTLQQQFASKIEAIKHQKNLIKESLAQSEQLLASRMQYYFE